MTRAGVPERLAMNGQPPPLFFPHDRGRRSARPCTVAMRESSGLLGRAERLAYCPLGRFNLLLF